MGKSRAELADCAAGCLVGMACGDALSRPLAGLSAKDIARRYGDITGYIDVGANEHEPARRCQRGVHGALTTMALAVVDSFLYGEQGPSGPDLARRVTALAFPRNHYLPWGALRGATPSLVRAIDSHARGDDWRLAGVREPDANALVYALPLGLLVGDAVEDVVGVAVDLTLTLHREPRSVAAAAGLVGVVRHVVENRSVTQRGMVMAAQQTAELACRYLSAQHPGVTSGSADAAAAAISMALGRSELEVCPTDVDCRDAPEIALAAIVAHVASGRPLLDVLALLCKQGGAVDVMATAVAGVIGSHEGAQHLPLGLVQGLRAQRHIEARAHAMLAPRPAALAPLYDLEIALAEHEGKWRAGLPSPPSQPRRSQLNLL